MRICILLFFINLVTVLAQDTTFQTVINVVVNGNDQARHIINTNNGYLVLSGTHCNDTGYGCIGLAEVDEMGEKIWSKVYNEFPDPSIANEVIKAESDGYFIAGTKASINGGRSYLMRLNSDGDSLWAKGYGLSTKYLFRNKQVLFL